MRFLHRFAITTFAVLTLLGILLGYFQTRLLTEHMIVTFRDELASLVESELEEGFNPRQLEEWKRTGIDVPIAQINDLMASREFFRLKIYDRQARVVWSNDPQAIGETETADSGAMRALRGERVSVLQHQATYEGAGGGQTPAHFMETYIPLRDRRTGRAFAAVEVYQGVDDLYGQIVKARGWLWVILFVGLAALWGLLYAVAAAAARTIDRQHRDLKDAHRLLAFRFTEIVRTLVSAIDAKDRYTKGHSVRVAAIAVRIGRAMGLSAEDLKLLELGAILHDVGKIGVRDAVLSKPSRLEPEEMEEIRRHPGIGVQLFHGTASFPPAVIEIIGLHHERPDGQGYPQGLSRDEIPLMARIVAVADCYDAMRSDRPYRRARSKEETVAELQRYKGTQFDETVVDALMPLTDEIEERVYGSGTAGQAPNEGGGEIFHPHDPNSEYLVLDAGAR